MQENEAKITENNKHQLEVSTHGVSDKVLARSWEYIMTQHTLNKGLKIHGKDGEYATKKERQPLHDMETFEPINKRYLTWEEKQNAIASLMFLTKKIDEFIRAWACGDCQKQQTYTEKTETALPTIMTESIFITAAIDTKKGRDSHF